MISPSHKLPLTFLINQTICFLLIEQHSKLWYPWALFTLLWCRRFKIS